MSTYSRTNLSLLGAWWLSLDRWNIAALFAWAGQRGKYNWAL